MIYKLLFPYLGLQVKLTLTQKDAQLESLQQEHLELMKQLTNTQENLHTKEQSLNQLEARYLELEAQLAELQTDATAKEDTIQFLQNEKIVLEVALQAARADKSQIDEGAEKLGEDVLVAADVLDQLKQEVQVKATQVRVQDLVGYYLFPSCLTWYVITYLRICLLIFCHLLLQD